MVDQAVPQRPTTAEYGDFQEIGHCGGQATFNIVCDEQGRKQYSLGFRHQRPGPASWVGIYALSPHGIPVQDFRMGGIRQPFEPQCPEGCVPVFLGSDSRQCWGHQCQQCNGYFRNGHHPAIYPLTCPYCGLRTEAYSFLTEAQRNYVSHYVDTLMRGLDAVRPGANQELVIDMDAIARQDADQPRPDFYYVAETQQTRYHCVKCDEFNDIRGRFGYCAACGYRNNLPFLKLSCADIRDRLNGNGLDAPMAVRTSVSEFDACCRDFINQVKKRIRMKPSRKAELDRLIFHDVESPTIAVMKTMFDIDLLRNVGDELPFIKMMMHRRHVFEHNAGVADDRYVELSGDPDARNGVLIRENRQNVHRLISGLIRMAENFDGDFHEIFSLTELPIRLNERRPRRPA